MQQRFSDHPRLYSGPCFAPRQPAPVTAGASERVAFFCGAAFMWLAFPITLAATFFFVRRIRAKGLQTA